MEAKSEGITNIPLHFAIDAQHLHQTGKIASILFFLIGGVDVLSVRCAGQLDDHDCDGCLAAKIDQRSQRPLAICGDGICDWFGRCQAIEEVDK